MLLTRCPHCDTTFRVTDEALAKAKGQVRCGRCASIFNAHTELREQTDAPHAAAPHADAPRAAAAPCAPSAPTDPPSAGAASPATAAAALPLPVPSEPGAAGLPPEMERELSVAAVVAQIEIGSAAAAADESDGAENAAPMSAAQIDQVLGSDTGAGISAPAWQVTPERPASRVWKLGAALAFIALGAQAVNHWKTDLADTPVVGPALQRVYAMLGSELRPAWNVGQYQILDWVATAEPNARGNGSLRITARINNRGPKSQPYPEVKLKLKDRWEATVASRMFKPSEYLDSTLPSDRLMAPGETARAQIEVLDPGPDAYGFELDICVEILPGQLSCGTDEVFL